VCMFCVSCAFVPSACFICVYCVSDLCVLCECAVSVCVCVCMFLLWCFCVCVRGVFFKGGVLFDCVGVRCACVFFVLGV